MPLVSILDQGARGGTHSSCQGSCRHSISAASAEVFMTQPGLEFGLVPHQVVADLRDIGNWKVGGTHSPHPLDLRIWHPYIYSMRS